MKDSYIPPKKPKKDQRADSPLHTVRIPGSKTPGTAAKKTVVTPTPTRPTNGSNSNKSTATRNQRRLPVVCSDPAECSYSSLLRDCVISYLSEPRAPLSEHVQKLCDCMGACYLDHLEDYTTHVVLPSDLSYNEAAVQHTTAKLVSVEWLERCLDEKTRLREEDYEVL